jgi:hypothetical protein
MKNELEGQMNHVTLSMGESFPGEVTRERASELGIAEWRLSEKTISRIESIESNIRLAESQSGLILVS